MLEVGVLGNLRVAGSGRDSKDSKWVTRSILRQGALKYTSVSLASQCESTYILHKRGARTFWRFRDEGGDAWYMPVCNDGHIRDHFLDVAIP